MMAGSSAISTMRTATSRSKTAFTRFMVGTRPLFITSALSGGFALLWKSLYSTVVARARRYVRRMSPDGATAGGPAAPVTASCTSSSARQRKRSPAGARYSRFK